MVTYLKKQRRRFIRVQEAPGEPPSGKHTQYKTVSTNNVSTRLPFKAARPQRRSQDLLTEEQASALDDELLLALKLPKMPFGIIQSIINKLGIPGPTYNNVKLRTNRLLAAGEGTKRTVDDEGDESETAVEPLVKRTRSSLRDE